MHTGDENDSRETALLTSTLDGLIARHRCAIILAHHNRKASPFLGQDTGTDAIRGSTGFTGWLSFCLNLRAKPKERDVLYADFVKVRDAEEALPALTLEFERASIDFKVSVRSEAIDLGDAIKTAIFHNGPLKKTDIILAVKAHSTAGIRQIRDTITALEKAGKLTSTVRPEDQHSKAKTYSLPPEQMAWEEE
jgi:hypothetical protein